MSSVSTIAADALFASAAIVAIIPSFLFAAGRRNSSFPVLALTGLFYAIFFAIPPFLISRAWYSKSSEYSGPGIYFEIFDSRTGIIVLGGILALIGSYWCLSRLLPSQLRLPQVAPIRNRRRLWLFLWLAALAHTAFLYVPRLNATSSLAQAMEPLGLFALGMLFVEMMRGRLDKTSTAALIVLAIPTTIAGYARTELVTPAILLIIYLTTLFIFAGGRLRYAVAFMAMCVVFVFPVLKMPRLLTELPTASAAEYNNINSIPANVIRRIALVSTLQRVVELTPHTVPFWGGATFANLVTNPVPRFLWHDKPKEVMGQTFGHRYRLIDDRDMNTSMNLPWLIEFYVNFGLPGVFIGMALAGGMMAALEWLLLRDALPDVQIVAGWALVFPLTYQASNVSLMLGGLPSQAIFMALVVIFISLIDKLNNIKIANDAHKTESPRSENDIYPASLERTHPTPTRQPVESDY